MPSISIFFFFFFFLLPISSATLLQIQILHRHGARDHLIRHPFDTSIENPSGPRSGLTNGGIVQLTNLGRYIRTNYLLNSSNLIKDINPDKIRRREISARSSNTARTIMSSSAFWDGLSAQAGKNVPAMVFEDEYTDWVLRGYSICNRLVDKMEKFRNGDEFQDKSNNKGDTNESNADFVKRIGKELNHLGKGDAKEKNLEHVFNVYDRYLIARNNHFKDGSSHEGPAQEQIEISEQEFQRLKSLADWYESAKYDYNTHGLHVAGGILAQVKAQIEAFIKEDRDRPQERRKIVEYSAHYPTLLTVLAALREDSPNSRKFPADKIPGFAAALIFELHEEEGKNIVKLKWFRGDANWKKEEDHGIEFEPFAMERGQCVDKDKGCELEQFLKLIEESVFADERGFCDECDEKDAMVCKALNSGCAAGTRFGIGFLGALIGMVLGMAMSFLFGKCTARRKRISLGGDSGRTDEGGLPFGDVTA